MKEKIKEYLVLTTIVMLCLFLFVDNGFAENYYLVKKDGTKINVEKLLPNFSAAHPIPIEIYIPSFWGGEYKKFNGKYGEKYGRKVLGGYDYSSAAILAIMYNGEKVVDEKGKTVKFLPETIRESLFYAVATPTKINNVLYEVIRDYIVNDTKECPNNNSEAISGGGASR